MHEAIDLKMFQLWLVLLSLSCLVLFATKKIELIQLTNGHDNNVAHLKELPLSLHWNCRRISRNNTLAKSPRATADLVPRARKSRNNQPSLSLLPSHHQDCHLWLLDWEHLGFRWPFIKLLHIKLLSTVVSYKGSATGCLSVGLLHS